MWVISLFQKCSKIYIKLLHIISTRNKSLGVQAKILFFRSCIFHLPSLSTHSEWFGSYYQHRQVFPINRYGKFSKSNLNRHRWLFVSLNNFYRDKKMWPISSSFHWIFCFRNLVTCIQIHWINKLINETPTLCFSLLILFFIIR